MEGVFSPSICCSYKEGTITHTYDNQSHLLKAAGDTTYTYTYDGAGNILTANGHTYTYGDANWKDLLTAFDGQAITYDSIGNPTSYYNGTRWNFTWANGRSLATASDGSNSLSFAYDASDLRTSKTVNGVTYRYYYAGGKLMRMTWGSNTIDFFYDANGTPYAMKYDGAVYYYVTNLQGDVMYIMDANQNGVASYDYDPYGKVISAMGILSDVNPLRYRGYVYDQETGFYYLQSRYYDPAVGRFINADSYASTGQGIIGYNMFAYCGNSPVNFSDETGHVAIQEATKAGLWLAFSSLDGPSLVLDVIGFLILTGIFYGTKPVDKEEENGVIAYAKKGSNNGQSASLFTDSAVSPPDPDDWNRRNWQKVNEKYLEKQLEKQGTSPHQLKRDYLGQKAEIKRFDIYADKGTGQLAIFEKSTGNLVAVTDYFIGG